LGLSGDPPAKFLGLEDQLGTIEKGWLIWFCSTRIRRTTSATRRGSVVVNGRYLSRAELDKMLAGAEGRPAK
jgi:hypothetical protein